MKYEENKLCGWKLELGKVEYQKALDWQRMLVKLRRDGMARDTIILVEHPSVITVGKDDNPENYKNLEFEPIKIERGGDVTYHGPGQLVVYFIFNLARRGKDLHKFMDQIQQGILNILAKINISARKDEENTGIWVDNMKIASIGIAVKNWITYHGAAININTDIEEFKKINPCGLESKVMTSAQKILGKKQDFSHISQMLLDEYSKVFDIKLYDVNLEDIAEDIESQSGGTVI